MFDLIKTFRVLAVLLVAGFMVNCGGKKEEEELPADDMLSDIETVAPATTKDTAAAIPAKETAAEKKSALASRYTPNFSDNGKYVVQVSVFVSRKAANRLATKFTEEGYAAYVAEVQNPTGDLTGTYYRVRIGNFSGVSDAKDFGENVVADMGYNFWIDNNRTITWVAPWGLKAATAATVLLRDQNQAILLSNQTGEAAIQPAITQPLRKPLRHRRPIMNGDHRLPLLRLRLRRQRPNPRHRQRSLHQRLHRHPDQAAAQMNSISEEHTTIEKARFCASAFGSL